ncbi:VQ motif-containing protein [Quillaja saponaria]|uniref:VQ motif-containing protein n=1 Tax=Quillaja saponaria TaxID=32244 RepID=A0AAD7KUI8_QUISA|nr:VQ motif-containing protein [Quillaja saponaria]
MDSGNSGSMQSSSTGGDEEYDSRADSISAFLNNPPNSHVGSLPNPHHPQPPAASTQLFDQLSNYFDPIQRSPSLTNPQNSLLNLDMGWSKPFRSDPNSTDLSVLIPSSPTQLNQAFFGQTRGTAAFPAIQQMHPSAGYSRKWWWFTRNFTLFLILLLPLQPHHSLLPSLVSDAIASNSLTATTNSTSTNYQLSSSTNPLNMNMLNFQSFLQSPHPKQGPPNLENLKMGHHVLEEFGLSSNHHGTGNLNSGLEIDQSNEALSSGTNNDGNGIGDHHHQQLLRSSLNGNTNFGGGSVNGKVNYSGPSSDFHGDRGPECLAAGTRNEGMMESWINCSSD